MMVVRVNAAYSRRKIVASFFAGIGYYKVNQLIYF